jgi:NADH:ubiquinone oxidoreductase subunit F (NADH-binding)
MPLVQRVLGPPCRSLGDYVGQGGGTALEYARLLGPAGVIDEITAAGLRGRGGAGFPTGTKWQTVAESASSVIRTSVVVNGAEGEPGTFKDRSLLRRNPYQVLEGALIAASAVDAGEVVVCLKASFEQEIASMARAISEIHEAAWAPDVRFTIVRGPSSYLFGEETALLEVVEGRQPFPRVDPPFRRGIDPFRTDVGHSASRVKLAAVGGTDAPPALVNNVETTANVVGILRNGAAWYREVGTVASPGTIICTITGHTKRHGVGEIPMGTPLGEAISLIGGGPEEGRRILAVLSGVANPILPADLLDTPLSFEGMARVGSGLGAGGFIVFDDHTDMAAVAQSASRFLAIESCGQCDPCKRDGLAISAQLAALRNRTSERGMRELRSRLGTVTRGARCSLASQQENVVGSILERFGLDRSTVRDPEEAVDERSLILPLVDIVAGRAVLDTSHLGKQPDWTHGTRDSGTWPAARLGNQPVTIEPARVRQAPSRRLVDDIDSPTARRPNPLPTFARMHDELEGSLRQLLAVTPAEREPAARELHALLARHLDAMQRVLYPMVRRVAGAAGDDASWTAEHAERRAAHVLDGLEELLAQGEAGRDAFASVIEGVHAQLSAERDVVGLVQRSLDDDDLTALDHALEEALQRAPRPSSFTTHVTTRGVAPERREAS